MRGFLAILLVTFLVFKVVILAASAAPTSCSKCGASIKATYGAWEDTQNHQEKAVNGKLMPTMIGAINDFERTNLLERQWEGIAIAVMEHKHKGCKEVRSEDFPSHYERFMRREVNKAQLAKELNISRPTLDKLIMEHIQKLGA